MPRTVDVIIEETDENEVVINEGTDEFMQQIFDAYGDIDFDLTVNNDVLEQCYGQLGSAKTAKDITRVLEEMMSRRNSFRLLLSPSEYFDFLVTNTTRIKTILAKDLTGPKGITKIFSRVFSPLDQRLVCIAGTLKMACEQNISAEEIEKFKLGFRYSLKYSKIYRPFDDKSLVKNLTNYGVALMSIKEMFERCVDNPHGFKNLIYAPISVNRGATGEEQPMIGSDHAFYHLEKSDGLKRYWIMDCRLEKLSLKIKDVVGSYCIDLFKKLYKLALGHNNYIADYKSKSNLLEFDCEQLLQNIVFTINFAHFNSVLRDIVKRCCKLAISQTVDKFDSYADDEVQARIFKQYKLQSSEITNTFKLLFDNIDDVKAIELYERLRT